MLRAHLLDNPGRWELGHQPERSLFGRDECRCLRQQPNSPVAGFEKAAIEALGYHNTKVPQKRAGWWAGAWRPAVVLDPDALYFECYIWKPYAPSKAVSFAPTTSPKKETVALPAVPEEGDDGGYCKKLRQCQEAWHARKVPNDHLPICCRLQPSAVQQLEEGPATPRRSPRRPATRGPHRCSASQPAPFLAPAAHTLRNTLLSTTEVFTREEKLCRPP